MLKGKCRYSPLESPGGRPATEVWEDAVPPMSTRWCWMETEIQDSHVSAVNWGCISINLKTPPTFNEGKMTAKHSSWSLLRYSCLLQGGGVKYSSNGRINIGSSWWRAFRWWGVPFSFRQILSLHSHRTSFSHSSFHILFLLGLTTGRLLAEHQREF